MNHVSHAGPIPAAWNQNQDPNPLEEKMDEIIDLLDRPVIDVTAVKDCFSNYNTLAMECKIDSQKGCEQILESLKHRLASLALAFPRRFNSDDVVAVQQKLLDDILNVIFFVRGYGTSQLALNLMTQIRALKQLETQIFWQKHVHAGIIEDKCRCPNDPRLLTAELKISVANRKELSDQLIQIGLDLRYGNLIVA